MASSYSAIPVVNQIHSLPHLNSALQDQSNNFGITYDAQQFSTNAYVKSLLPIPIIIEGICFLVVITYSIAICCRSCFSCCKCGWLWKGREIPPIRRFYFGFFLCVGFVLVTNQMLILGNSFLQTGFSSAVDGFNTLTTNFNSIIYDTDSLNQDAYQLLKYYSASNSNVQPYCDTSYLTYATNEFIRDINEISTSVSDIPGKTSSVANDIDKYGDYITTYILWFLYGVLTIGVLFYCLGLKCKSKCFLKFTIGFNEIVILLIFVICAAGLFGLVISIIIQFIY